MSKSLHLSMRSTRGHLLRRWVLILLGIQCTFLSLGCGKAASKSEASQEQEKKSQESQLTTGAKLQADPIDKTREEQQKQRTSSYYPTPLNLVGSHDQTKLIPDRDNDSIIKELKLTNLDGKLVVERVLWVKTYPKTNANTVHIWDRSGKQVLSHENKYSTEIKNKPGRFFVNDWGSTIASDHQILLYTGFVYRTNSNGTESTWRMKFTMSHPLLRDIPEEEGVFTKLKGSDRWIAEIVLYIPVIKTHFGELPKEVKNKDNGTIIDFSYLFPVSKPDPPARGGSQYGDCIFVENPDWTDHLYDMRIKRYINKQGQSVGYQIHTSHLIKKIQIEILQDGQITYSIN